ncbi:MAG: aldehyde dehydrogenase family protein [Deltaproteobacteria bacterium]|nr:aldehyde dehydrogenase family protein [Deltaproteobacteria bacterium]
MAVEFGRLKNLINGEWKDSQSDDIWEIRNPALDEVIGEVPMSTGEEVAEAVQSARDAFAEWRTTPPVSRARYILRLVELLEENFEELSIVQTKEHGKTIDESDIASGIDEYIVREPLGVFACIPPFNFPFMVPLWFLPYAVATGNTFIIKPSPSDPISQVKLHELLDEAGIPPGVINLVHGGADVANMLMESDDIKGITFVGSTPVAKLIYQKCGETGKRVIAQGGAKNFLVIMPDCDLKETIPSLMTSFYGNSGQRCLSGANAVIVGKDDAFYKKFVDAFVEAASRIKVGNGLEEEIQMGPLQSRDKKERVLGYIEKGIAEGAKLLLDGRQPKIEGDYPPTCFLNPSVFESVTPDMTIGKEEIFGPVASIMRADNMDRAIEMIHSIPFGNAASIFTMNGGWAREFEYRVQTGNIGINIGIVAPMAFFPFSGMKDSFFGILHGQGKDAVRFFTESKVVIKRWF